MAVAVVEVVEAGSAVVAGSAVAAAVAAADYVGPLEEAVAELGSGVGVGLALGQHPR